MAKRATKLSGIAKKITKSTNAAKNNGSMKMTMYTAPTMVPRAHQKERPRGRPIGKKLSVPRNYTGKARSMARRSLDPCDNSNDSGLGFDNHMDHHMASINDRMNWSDERPPQPKRQKLEQLHVDIKLENDEINDNYTFPEHSQIYRDNTSLIRTAPPSTTLTSLSVSNSQSTSSGRVTQRCNSLATKSPVSSPVTLTSQLQANSRYLDISLSIICQPEQQHRARYQTEGSRGAVKDRSGNGFPIVQLKGYNKPATLQVFIGTDMGKVSPHMFYQACRVSGKNSTPCSEKKIDGTIVIELQLDPGKEMMATCDCVGILKERNVDVEHRFPDQLTSRSKKKSTKCRMVFRTTITHSDGMQETLQACSQPIVCTQPPGVPEISKKSLTSCPASGGLELFIIGKNFLKDTLVYFQLEDDLHTRWEQSVVPDKEYLQQTHLVCVVPPYMHPDITEPVTVRLYVVSSGKSSEPHQFVYTPVNGAMPSVHVEQPHAAPFLSKMPWIMTKQEQQDVDMMPPPGSSLVPLSQRRSSTNVHTSNEVHSPPMRSMKEEQIDENSQNSVLDSTEITKTRFRHMSESSLDVHQGDSNISMINDNSIDLLRHNQIMHENSNLSIVTENSIDILRTTINDESRCTNFASQNVLRQSEIENLKVMDLRMKMPMATVADLVDTNAPSMATLQSLGVTENNNVPLPAQSAQSVENYLTNIENKPAQVIQTQQGGILETSLLKGNTTALNDAGTYISTQTPLLQSSAASEATKVENVAIIENGSQVTQAIDSSILSTPIISEKLEALVSCAVNNHLSPQKESQVILSPQDIILNGPISPILSTTIAPPQLNTGVLNTTNSGTISPEVILNTQISPTLICGSNPQETLLTNNLTSICHTNTSVDTNLTTQLLSSTNASSLGLVVTEPEKAIILNAAADFLETQKKLNLPSTNANTTIISDILTTANGDIVSNLRPLPNAGNNFYPSSQQTAAVLDDNLLATKDNKSEFVLNVPLKEIAGVTADKKAEDRMIPSAFATMSENDLINIINPSCFDQV